MMKFQFDSIADFVVMNGHGAYVWASYGVTFAVLIFLLVSPLLQKKALIKQLQKTQKLEKLAQANSAAGQTAE